jgi:hypothetical protein
MTRLSLRNIALACLSAFLVACGGGGGSQDMQATEGAGEDNLASAGCGIFCPSLLTAPPDGATISDFVRFDLTAMNVKHAELLPVTGYTPQYGRFNLLPNPTATPWISAWMDLDTRKLPNGPFSARVVIFDAPAGMPARQQVVLSRTWIIRNTAVPSGFSVTSINAPGNGTVMTGTRRLEVYGTELANVELLPATGYIPRLGVFNITPDRTYAWLDLDTRTQTDGIKNVRISAFNVTEGQANAREIVAMPARQWKFQNGLGAFNGNAVIAPAHGSILGHYLRVEIHGTGLENVELLPRIGYLPRLGTGYISPDKTKASLFVDLRTLPKGLNEVRVSAYNKPAGQAGAKEIVVMPARQFYVR